VAPAGPDRRPPGDEPAELAAFVSTIDFAVSDVAIVRAGGERQIVTGALRDLLCAHVSAM
jgi:hypothetical protein